MELTQLELELHFTVRAVVGSKVSSTDTGKSPDIQISTPQPPPPQPPTTGSSNASPFLFGTLGFASRKYSDQNENMKTSHCPNMKESF